MGVLKGLFLTVAVAFTAHRVFKAVVFLKPGKTIFEHKPGPCHTIEGASEGSEDMALLPNGKVLITSGLRFRTESFPNRKGRILLFDFKKPKVVEELEIVWKDEDRFFQDFNPHGIDTFITKAGKMIVFVVNHTPHEAIERFDLDLKKKTLKHLESIRDPTMRLMNSVVATSERSFFFTNFMYRRSGILAELEIPLDLKYGSLCSYDGLTSKGKILQGGYNMPNGLALSKDKTKLYLADIGSLSIDTFNISSISEIALAHTLHIDTVVDNIQTDPVDGSLWLGCQPTAWLSAQYLAKPDKMIAPSQVLHAQVDSHGFLLDDVTEIYTNRGQEISTSSVALHYQKKLLIGSVSHNTVYCEIHN